MKVLYMGMIIFSETFKGVTSMYFNITDIIILQNKARVVANDQAMVVPGMKENKFEFNPARMGMDSLKDLK